MKRPHVSLVFLAMLIGLMACNPPIWNKMQKRAAVVQGLAPMPARSVLVADDFSDWKAHWTEESETPGQIRFLTPDSCLDIVAPKGLTLWYNAPFKGNLSIRFQIRAVSGPETTDRCSDLNCFWMASDPLHPDSILSRKDFRNGQFGKYYSLRLYYLGYGGNSNTTTRFRRYDGDYEAFQRVQSRPAVQAEYTNKEHLIKPNHWYSVRIDVHDGVVYYWSDNELLVNYKDPSPLTKGWFGFRTTQNHLQIREFSVSKPL